MHLSALMVLLVCSILPEAESSNGTCPLLANFPEFVQLGKKDSELTQEVAGLKTRTQTTEAQIAAINEKFKHMTNLALMQPAFQSSTYGDGGGPAIASKANDGVANNRYEANSCTHTSNRNDNNPWWKVKLERFFTVTKVDILARYEYGSNNLKGANVYVGDEETYMTLCGTIGDHGAGSWITVRCSIKGNVVKITKSGVYLMLCEVRVYA